MNLWLLTSEVPSPSDTKADENSLQGDINMNHSNNGVLIPAEKKGTKPYKALWLSDKVYSLLCLNIS